MRYSHFIATLFLGVVLIFAACSKEKSYESANGGNGNTGGNTDTTGTGNAGGTYGSTVKVGTNAAMKACVDTSFFNSETVSGMTLNSFAAVSTDSLGNQLVVLLQLSTKNKLVAETYNSSIYQASLSYADITGNEYVVMPGTSSNCTVTVTNVTATDFTLTFSGSLVNPLNNQFITIAGSMKGLIGRATACGQ